MSRFLAVAVVCFFGALSVSAHSQPKHAGSAADPAAAQLPELSIELHSHLFMKQALGWFFNGPFDGPLEADSWQDRLACKANAPTLAASGVGLHVVALFAHPVYTLDMRASLRRQIATAKRFCDGHPDWVLARTANEARRQLLAGKRVMVLSLEGASGVLESEEDLREFIDEAGIAIVTPLHLVDDRFGGVATMRGFQYLANPLGVVDALMDPHCAADGIARNGRGLTPLGATLVRKLVERGVWIDLTHSSDAAMAAILPLLAEAQQPLLFTHTTPRRFQGAERAISDAMLRQVAASRGIIGLLPSEDAFPLLQVPARYCPAGCSQEQCAGGMHAFAAMYDAVARIVGAEAVVLGSDFNGGMRHLRPSCRTGSSLDEPGGLRHIGQLGEVWRALADLGATVPAQRRTMARFLAAWARVKPRRLADARESEGASEFAPWPSRRAVEGPGLEAKIRIGMSAGPGVDPSMLAGVDVAVLKDQRRAEAAEPTVYLAHLQAEMSRGLRDASIVHAEARLAALGIRARDGDNRLMLEALNLRIARHTPIDQAMQLQISALHGRARWMPGLLKWPDRFNLFMGLGFEALGYRRGHYISDRDALNGLYVIGGMAELGVRWQPAEEVFVRAFGRMQADVDFTQLEPFSRRSNVLGSVGMALGLPRGTVEPFVDLNWLGVHEVGGFDSWLITRQWRAGIDLPL